MSSEDLLLQRLMQYPDVTMVCPATPYQRGRVCAVEPADGGVSLRLLSRHVMFWHDRLGEPHRDVPFTLWLDTPVRAIKLSSGDLVLFTGNSVVIVHPPGRHLPPEGFTATHDLCDVLGRERLAAVLAVEFSTNMDAPKDPWHPREEDGLELLGIRSVRLGRPREASVDAREVRLTLVDVSAIEKDVVTPSALPVELTLDRELPVFELPCGSKVTFACDKVVFFI